MTKLGLRLYRLRTSRNLSIKDASQKVGISSKMLYDYESGKHLTDKRICQLADFYGVTTDYLLGRTEKED